LFFPLIMCFLKARKIFIKNFLDIEKDEDFAVKLHNLKKWKKKKNFSSSREKNLLITKDQKSTEWWWRKKKSSGTNKKWAYNQIVESIYLYTFVIDKWNIFDNEE
jgi:hypothetical protein